MNTVRLTLSDGTVLYIEFTGDMWKAWRDAGRPPFQSIEVVTL